MILLYLTSRKYKPLVYIYQTYWYEILNQVYLTKTIWNWCLSLKLYSTLLPSEGTFWIIPSWLRYLFWIFFSKHLRKFRNWYFISFDLPVRMTGLRMLKFTSLMIGEIFNLIPFFTKILSEGKFFKKWLFFYTLLNYISYRHFVFHLSLENFCTLCINKDEILEVNIEYSKLYVHVEIS